MNHSHQRGTLAQEDLTPLDQRVCRVSAQDMRAAGLRVNVCVVGRVCSVGFGQEIWFWPYTPALLYGH
eukprot:2528092-Prymnesium_polylepis.2